MSKGNDILLVSLPWGSIEQPSLAFGLIKALLAREGMGADVRYCNLEFAATVGLELYRSLKDRDVLACDWIFAEAAFGPFREPSEFLGFLARRGYPEEDLQRWARVQAAAAPFIEQCAQSIDWKRYRVVGFTTTMVQSLASLALARRAKELNPELRIVFGGANCEGEMGVAMLENFEFIDVVARRDCDGLVGELFSRLREGRSLQGLQVCYREQGAVHIAEMPPIFHDLDRNPFPDYDDYFEQLRSMPYAKDVHVNIVFEGSRGCWYGQKIPCTFCAVNGSSMEYRAKSPGRLVDELAHLAERHGVTWFGAADNILDHRSQAELCRAIEARIPNAKIFFDVKSNLTRKQLIAMKRAGIDEVQPGIESFSTHVLKLMQKGVTGIRNIHVLRMFAEVGIWPMWNYLYGFPGERPSDYTGLMEFANPGLFHLPAPYVGFGLSMMRFSEYFNKPEAMGVRIRGPLPHYQYIFNLPPEQVFRLAYYFEYDYLDGYDPAPVGNLVVATTKAWNYAYYARKISLKATLEGQDVIISDDRFGKRQVHRLTGLAAHLYRVLERPRKPDAAAPLLAARCSADYLREGGVRGVRDILHQLRAARLVFTEGEQDVAIAVPEDPDVFWYFDGRPSVAEALPATAGDGRPKPSLLHWKVEHLYR
ncbi:MAG TPA: RiPP maturation radical SAM C-methyltransferase [Hyalangium sp.]|nr:RiPP maturation radical SAM C-methyltransferase [Hyalangium sp.]